MEREITPRTHGCAPFRSVFASPRWLLLIWACLIPAFITAHAQNQNLTVLVLINSQNTNGFNPSPATPGEYQRFAERYLEHLQVPYELVDVATASPPADINSRQLIIAGHSRLLLSAAWESAISNAVTSGTGFVNLDSDLAIGSESHMASIFGATGSAAGTPASQITIPAAVAPGGSSPHYITALQKKFDGPNNFTYPFHPGADGITRTATSTVLLNAQGTVIARLGNDPLILAATRGSGRAVHFGTLDYLHGDRFGFVMGLDDLFWRSLVWAARKPFVIRGYPRLWAVQIDDTRAGFGGRIGNLYNTALTGQASADGRGGPWKVTTYAFTNNLAPGSADRTQVIADINAGKLEISPHSFADITDGNMYWNPTTGPLTDAQWQTNLASINAWKQGNGGADTIPFFSRSMVPHFWNLSNNTGFDMWNSLGFRYITTIQKPNFWATHQNGGAERIPARPFWNYEMPPKTFQGSFTSEDFHFIFTDDFTVGSRAGQPAQTFFLFGTQYLDYAKYNRVDFTWPGALFANPITASGSVALLEQYTWRFWSGLSPVQLFTHDAANYEFASDTDRQAIVQQGSAWLNGNGVRHIFMDDLGDYIYARTKSTLTRASFNGAQIAYTFTGRAANADGALISTQLLLFQGDDEGSWQTVPGFTAGLLVNRDLPPVIQSASPASGPSTGGTTITITGTGFTSTTSVFFGQTSAASTTFVNSSTIQAVSPAGAEGAVELRVTNVNGSSSLPAAFTFTPPPRILVAAYAFNEGSGTTVGDTSGSGNNGTITNATWSNSGKFGKALSFSGTNSFVTVNDSSSLDLTTGMTLEAWVNPATTGGGAWRTALLKEQTNGLVYGLYANTNTNVPSGHVFIGTETDTRGTSALPLNTWTHLAVTFDGTTLRMFVNGVEASNKAIIGSIQASSGALRIGGNSVWGEYFSGLIDEVRIFNRASTAAEIQSDMTVPLGDSTPPSVAMTAPISGTTVSGTITVSANASDNIAVAGVQFLLDGAPLGAEDTSSPYSISWNTGTVANGNHTLSARARDGVGNTTTSSVVTVTVANAPDTTLPSVSMTAPADGATVSGTVTVSANASDNVGVAGVQFLLDGNALGTEDTSSPYSISWNTNTATSGPHTLSARARDGAGNTATSAVVNVTVVPPDTTAPLVSVTAPSNGATVTGTLTVSADASDNIGVVGVQFLLDGVALGAEDTTSPYSVSWNASASTNGAHTLSARARDAAGNTTTSALVTVTVTGGQASGLVAAYSFNEGNGTTVADSSGSNNNGTTSNTTWSTGKFGNALSFNGTNSWVTVNDANSLDLTNGITLEAWVNPNALGTAWRTAIMKEATGGLAYGLYGNGDTTRPSAHVFISSEQDTRGTAALALNTWTHLAMTFNGTTLRIFVNGVEASNKAISGSARVTTGVLHIGGNSIWGEYFSGLIDEVRIYNRALNATEIQADMNTPVGGPDTTPPTVSVTAPTNGATVSNTVTLTANATDNLGVAGVQFFVNGNAIGAEDTSSPFSISWDSTTVTNGAYSITARARDGAGNTATSAAVSVTVNNGAPPPPDTTSPTVSVTSPLNGSTVSGAVTLAANASDNVAVAGVQFYVNGTPIGTEDATAPYAVTWDSTTVSNGQGYQITARARDTSGNTGTSAAVSVTVNNSASAPLPGLVAAYAFNEGSGTSVADLSGSGNPGTISGASWSTSGKFGNALSFNGSNSWMTVNDSNSLDLTNGMTLEAWVNPSTAGGWRTALLKEQSGGLIYALYANTDTNRPSAHVFINAESETRGTAAVPTSAWTHLAATYDGTTLRLYVNGTQASSLAVGGSVRVSSGVLRIGGNSVWGEYFAGLIDEVRVYNRALSASEIQSDMNTPVGGAPPPPPVDTTPPTVVVSGPASGATVTGRTVLYADASDDVGVAGVRFFIDGSAFGSEITSPPFTTTWDTAGTSNTNHTITAVARDASGKQTTSSAVTVTVSNPGNAALIGSWSAPFSWPIVAINLVVTRTGDVLSWDGPPSNGGTSAQLWSPGSGNFTAVPNNATNMFCDAAVALPDGRIIALGGHSSFVVGVRNADVFNPITRQWTSVAPMNSQRWYPTATVLPDGRILAVSGATTCETCIADTPEIYNPSTNTWSELAGARWAVNLYPHLFVLPDGRILEASVSRQVTETRVLDLTTQTWTTVDANALDGHTAVMYEPGKIMKAGSASDVNVSTGPSASTTYTIDMTQPSPKWQQTPNMAFPRSFQNLTLLPDGSALTTGGGSTRDGVDYANSVLAAELWSPQTKTWTTMASQQNGRLYHGSAVLLLDGRVLVAGSGRVGPAPQLNAEIYSPPYLFKGPRPTISSIPAQATHGATFFVGTPDPSAISTVTLLKISAATHGFNMDQRILRLSFSSTTGGLNVQAPANGNLAPPGYYVLFLLNSAGVPSVGGVIQIQ